MVIFDFLYVPSGAERVLKICLLHDSVVARYHIHAAAERSSIPFFIIHISLSN